MQPTQENYRRALRPLLAAALRAPDLHTWSAGFLTVAGRRLDDRWKDDEVLALERYLLENSGLPAHVNDDLLAAFADEIHRVCHDETLSLRISYNGVAWLLDAWRFLTGMPLPSDAPQVILPCCAAVGTGVHAVAFLSAAEGTRVLMRLASGPLLLVREAAAQGLRRMLAGDWLHTMYELRRYAHIGDALEHGAAVRAVAAPELLSDRAHALDALDLYHAILAAYRRLPPASRQHGEHRALAEALAASLGIVIAAGGEVGLAAARTWLAWDDAEISRIVQAGLEQVSASSSGAAGESVEQPRPLPGDR